MKKTCITFLLLTIILLSGAGIMAYGGESVPHTEYLRIHIRADSNSECDQRVKYLVKDAVVGYLTPIIAEIKTKEQAKKALIGNLAAIEKVADGVLGANGFDYTAKAKLKNEEFPTRVYDDLTLEKGFYDSLIIELGSGKGDNWWCVVYPPLCFTGGGAGYIYKSKIIEIINDFKKRI